jgi:hypothetical protein
VARRAGPVPGLAGAAGDVLEAAGDRKTAARDADVREQTAAEEIHEVGHTWIIAAETPVHLCLRRWFSRPVHKGRELGLRGDFELRDRDSNPNFRFQRPASYR